MASAASAPMVSRIGWSLARAGREREDRVAVARGVRRHDRAGEAVMSHLRDSRRLRLGQRGVGGDDADGGVLQGLGRRQFELAGLEAAAHVRQTLAVFRAHAGDDLPVAGSTMSPRALTATIAATTRPFGRVMAALPMPPFIARSRPPILPTVAPAPAPTFPSATGPSVAAFAAWKPHRRLDESVRRRPEGRTGSRPGRLARLNRPT